MDNLDSLKSSDDIGQKAEKNLQELERLMHENNFLFYQACLSWAEAVRAGACTIDDIPEEYLEQTLNSLG